MPDLHDDWTNQSPEERRYQRELMKAKITLVKEQNADIKADAAIREAVRPLELLRETMEEAQNLAGQFGRRFSISDDELNTLITSKLPAELKDKVKLETKTEGA